MAGIGALGSRKGIFFALSALLLAASLIALASGISDVSSRSRATATALVDTDFAANAHADMQTQVIRVMSEWANLTCENDSITMSEILPPKAGFSSDLDSLSDFYSQYMRSNVSANFTSLGAGSYQLAPQGTQVSNAGTISRIYNADSAQGGQLLSVNLTLMFPAGEFSVRFTESSWPPCAESAL